MAMLAQAMRLPIARAERQRHPQVLGEMHQADPSKIKSTDMVISTSPVV